VTAGKGERQPPPAVTGPPAGALPDVLRLPVEQRLRVNEIFYSLQGESSHAGRPCVLIRLTGCHLRCVWCDTAYAFYEGEWLSRDEVLRRVAAFDCPLVELTGGEPLLQPGALPLLTALCDAGHEVLLETSGAVDVAPVDARVRRIVDVKCPGSGEAERNHWPNLGHLRASDELKLVLADEQDYRWARELVLSRRLHERCPVWLSPAAGALAPRQLAEWILRDRLPVRLQLQLHKLLWGETRGV
jgi:7-carboxy-7-deazaguanine synthase